VNWVRELVDGRVRFFGVYRNSIQEPRLCYVTHVPQLGKWVVTVKRRETDRKPLFIATVNSDREGKTFCEELAAGRTAHVQEVHT